ncbi:hypothetical protein PGB90_010439 [Kerria lacca]
MNRSTLLVLLIIFAVNVNGNPLFTRLNKTLPSLINSLSESDEKQTQDSTTAAYKTTNGNETGISEEILGSTTAKTTNGNGTGIFEKTRGSTNAAFKITNGYEAATSDNGKYTTKIQSIPQSTTSKLENSSNKNTNTFYNFEVENMVSSKLRNKVNETTEIYNSSMENSSL